MNFTFLKKHKACFAELIANCKYVLLSDYQLLKKIINWYFTSAYCFTITSLADNRMSQVVLFIYMLYFNCIYWKIKPYLIYE
jgi:hypothetical protein